MKVTALLLACALLAGGCTVPTDPDGTLDRARGGTMRVGMTEAVPWAEETDGQRSGVEVYLVERFAEALGARIEWSDGSEEELFEELHEGRLDLVIGGITAMSPWMEKGAFTRPYATVLSELGQKEKHVMATKAGENDFLTELDFFLQRREGAIEERLEREGELSARRPAGEAGV
jgi:polar amino acid transport system substrate-binding protein